MDEAILYTYTKTDVDPKLSSPLGEVSSVKLRRPAIDVTFAIGVPLLTAIACLVS